MYYSSLLPRAPACLVERGTRRSAIVLVATH